MYYLKDPVCQLWLFLMKLFTYSTEVHIFYSLLCSFLMVFILSVAAVFQIANMVKYRFGMQTIIENVPTTIVLFACLICLCTLYVKKSDYKEVICVLDNFYAEQVNRVEFKIVEKYRQAGILVADMITIAGFIGAIIVTLSGFISQILDVIMPLNESRLRELPFRGEHFIDEQDYFYAILFFQFLTILCVVTIVCCTECILIVVICQACGFFAAIGYQMEHAVDDIDVYRGEERLDKMIIIAIERAIRWHETTLRVVSLSASCSDVVLLCSFLATLIAFSISLLQVTNPQLLDIKSVLFSFAQIVQFYALNYVGQVLINESMKLPINAYFARWYECSPYLQKLFVVLILRTYKYCAISLFDLSIVSVQTFSTVSQTALSYYMVLRQFQ